MLSGNVDVSKHLDLIDLKAHSFFASLHFKFYNINMYVTTKLREWQEGNKHPQPQWQVANPINLMLSCPFSSSSCTLFILLMAKLLAKETTQGSPAEPARTIHVKPMLSTDLKEPKEQTSILSLTWPP